MSLALHVIVFPSKLITKWTEGINCDKLASSGGSSTKIGTLGVNSPISGYFRGVKGNFPIVKSVKTLMNFHVSTIVYIHTCTYISTFIACTYV
jgi:hypothetical protein